MEIRDWRFIVSNLQSLVSAVQTKTLWIKPEYLQQILDGRKTIEVRVGYSNITRLQVDDQLLLNGEHVYEIVRIGRYATFVDMLTHEDPTAIAPNIAPRESPRNDSGNLSTRARGLRCSRLSHHPKRAIFTAKKSVKITTSLFVANHQLINLAAIAYRAQPTR